MQKFTFFINFFVGLRESSFFTNWRIDQYQFNYYGTFYYNAFCLRSVKRKKYGNISNTIWNWPITKKTEK